jgi:hypothetical protein
MFENYLNVFFNDENDSLCIFFHLVPFGGLPVN